MMHNPPHPGEHVLEDCIEPLGLTITGAAKTLGVSRKMLSDLIHGKTGISADMAIRLSKVFGSSPDFWVRLQGYYDLWQAGERMKRWKPKQSYIENELRP